MAQKFEVILFDLGNTIFYIDFDKCFKYWGKLREVDWQILKSKFVFKENAHHKFERGLISEAEYAQHVSKMLDIPLSTQEFFIGWNEIYLDNLPGIQEVVAELHKAYRIAALSNTNSSHEKVWSVQFKWMYEYFEATLTSHGLGAAKPDKAIYLAACKELNIAPEKVVFLDDKKENITACEEVGMTGILVESPQQMYAALNELGVLSDDFVASLQIQAV